MKFLDTLASQKGQHDFLGLGAMVTRLDPGLIPFTHASDYHLHVSGGEYNVAANLSRCFGLNTAFATAMVDYPIGERVQAEVRAAGVTPYYIHYPHNGVNGPNLAQVWSDQGKGVRAPEVFYNRANEAAGLLTKDSFDWPGIFKNGVRWFHSGGIFAALSETTPEVILSGMKAAKKAGAIISFDLNYRAKLWAILGGKKQAQKVLREIVGYVDVLVGNEEDIQLGLGLEGPKEIVSEKLDPSAFLGMIDGLTSQMPNIKAVATTLREVKNTNVHNWSAVLWLEGKSYQAPSCELQVLDRVGGGDGFASGLIYGLLAGKSPEQALKLGWAHGALLTTYFGDTSMASLKQVEALASGDSARIKR
ncbi:MAG TPA: sugar kinase [Treponemataceae bacterium]|nr:sugar kinase [Treponemataceae bacterium]